MIKSIILSILTAIAFVLVAFGVCVGGTTEYLGLMLLIPVILFFLLINSLAKLSLTSCLMVGVIVFLIFTAIALVVLFYKIKLLCLFIHIFSW